MKSVFNIPDVIIYGVIVGLIVCYTNIKSEARGAAKAPTHIGEALPSDSPLDPSILITIDKPRSGTGTAFAINEEGLWLTARHVVDSCDRIALKVSDQRFLPVSAKIYRNVDLAVLSGDWTRKPIRSDIHTPRFLGEYGFFFGFPQGNPGEVVGKLLGRGRMKVTGRYTSNESILAWAESGRSNGLTGSLGGLSGGPVLDKDGEIIGVVTAESLRRGRVYTVAPRNLQTVIDENKDYKARPISLATYGLQADEYRRNRQISQVVCLVN
ncbi:MAG: serine protease [Maricaulaceae bacterium]